MVNDRVYGRLGKVAGRILPFALLGLWTGVGWAVQLQGDVLKDQARSAAQAASSATKGSGPTEAKPASSKTSRRAPAKRAEAAPPLPSFGRSPAIVGQRDPFKLPPPPGPAALASAAGEEMKGPAPPGKRGLVIGQLRLEGVVRLDQSNTMIAVVADYRNLAYFLRENDAVYNGVVSKIAPDSISFKENYLDQFGRAQLREVVKRLSGAPGEGR
jgi:hypothetical protein